MLFTGCAGNGTNETAADETNASVENEAPITRGTYKSLDYCTMKDYMGIKISEADIAAADEDVQAEIDTLIESATTLEEITEDRAVVEGDVVNIDYTGYLDGETFDSGSATGSDLEIGSNSFIDGFESGIVGAKKGDKLSLNLTFPESDSNTDLAGKDVVFEVTVNKIQNYVTPEYTDAFVAENTEFETMNAYEASLREEIRENNISAKLAEKLFEIAEFTGEYPETMKEYYKQMYISYYDSMMQSYMGYTLEAYVESVGTDVDTFIEEECAEDMEAAMQGDLLLGAIAELENLKAEGEEYEEYVETQAAAYGMEKDEFLSTYTEEEVQFVYKTNLAYEMVYDSLVIE